MSSIVINDTKGLATHDNDLSADVGSTSYADNVVFNRDGAARAPEWVQDYSTNLPDFAPTQLIASASQDQAYLHLDSGIWYNSGGTWYRKREQRFKREIRLLAGAAMLNGHFYVCDIVGHLGQPIHRCARRFLLAIRSRGSTDGTVSALRAVFEFDRRSLHRWPGIYLCDQGNHTIRKITSPANVVTTFAGSAGAPGTADANGTSGGVQHPIGIAWWMALFVATYVNQRDPSKDRL